MSELPESSCAVLIPAYNEATSIASIVRTAFEADLGPDCDAILSLMRQRSPVFRRANRPAVVRTSIDHDA